jgi:hypothetical protein
MSDVVESERVRFAYPTLRKEREGWGTRQLVAGIESKSAFIPHFNFGPKRRAVVGLRPSFFGPRIPDFLSRSVALSNVCGFLLEKAANVVVASAAL